MLFKRISRSTAETVFIVCQNVSGTSLTAGYNVVFDVGGSVNGVRVTQCSSTDLQAYAGCADATIANNAYGLVQVYGYRAAVYVYSSTGTSASGDELITTADSWALTCQATSADAKSFGFLCAAVSGSASSQYLVNSKAFIRAL